MTRTFVLVPGCWVGGWAWHPVARVLTERGHRVVVPEMPGMAHDDDPRTVSLADATTALVAQIERADVSGATVVAHDWSAYPVTAAAHRVGNRFGHLVHWASFVPAADESMLDAMPDEDAEMLLGRAKAAGTESVLLPFERWRTNFAQTATRPVQELTYGLLRPQPLAYLAESLSAADAALPDLPTTYLVGDRDLALLPGNEWWAPKYSDRLGVAPVRFDGTHAAHLTDPATVADVLAATAP